MAARERLYASVEAAGARLVTLSGDTHTAYANELFDLGGVQRGVEFACTSINSPGMGAYVKAVPDLGQMIADANTEIVWHDPFGHGYTLVTLTADEARGTYRKVSTVYTPEFTTETVAAYACRLSDGALSGLSPA